MRSQRQESDPSTETAVGSSTQEETAAAVELAEAGAVPATSDGDATGEASAGDSASTRAYGASRSSLPGDPILDMARANTPERLADLLRRYPGDPDPILEAATARYGADFVRDALALVTGDEAEETPDAKPKRDSGVGPPVPTPQLDTVIYGRDHEVSKKAREKRAKLKRDPGFEQISRRHGILDRGLAPESIRLPKSLVKTLDVLWEDSHREDGSVQEQGGNLVRKYNGDYAFRREDGFGATSFEADYGDVGRTQSLVGVVHTHPHDNERFEGDSFSAADMAGISSESEGQTLNILRSGDMTFVVARTKAFDKIVLEYEDEGNLGDLYDVMYECWTRIYEETEGTFQEKIEAAVLGVCEEFHLEYYSGKGETLTRVAGDK